jgi:hypothetical protein
MLLFVGEGRRLRELVNMNPTSVHLEQESWALCQAHQQLARTNAQLEPRLRRASLASSEQSPQCRYILCKLRYDVAPSSLPLYSHQSVHPIRSASEPNPVVIRDRDAFVIFPSRFKH